MKQDKACNGTTQREIELIRIKGRSPINTARSGCTIQLGTLEDDSDLVGLRIYNGYHQIVVETFLTHKDISRLTELIYRFKS